MTSTRPSEQASGSFSRAASTAMASIFASSTIAVGSAAARTRSNSSRFDACPTVGLPAIDRAEGTDPVVAGIVRLAADGLWLADILGTEPLTPPMRRRAIRRLRRLSQEEAT